MNLILKSRLIGEEGFSPKPYKDSEGYWTVGFGWCMDKRPLTAELAVVILEYQINETETQVMKQCSDWYPGLSDIRQSVILDIAFNMGISHLLGFHHMIAAIKAGDFEEAANQLLYTNGVKTPYYEETGIRAEALADLFRKG